MQKKRKFAVQQHYASHLHYDFRLERNGVLESWAIPKEPPVEIGVKRLAVRVEDHELGYEDFEGTIPKGQYGEGKVVIWDRGLYVEKKYGPKEIIVALEGGRLKGDYCLIKLKPSLPKDKNWLFFKRKCPE